LEVNPFVYLFEIVTENDNLTSPEEETVNHRIMHFIGFDIKHINYNIIKIYMAYLKNTIKGNPLASEIFFWQRLYNEYSKSKVKPIWWDISNSVDKSPEVLQILVDLKGKFGSNLTIIDVGSGPVTSFFEKIDVRKNKIICVDPLAKIYNDLNIKYKINQEAIIQGYGEKLHEIFPAKSAHFILTQNAIDHSTNPKSCVDEMLNLLVDGGILCMYGFVKEGTAANWLGLHQWDIMPLNGTLCLSNRDQSINNQPLFSQDMVKIKEFRIDGIEPGDYYHIILEKKLP
jgi:hypothetical protein